MRPFSTLKVRYIDKRMGEDQRRTIFDKLVENKITESSNFQADPEFSLVFFKASVHVTRALTRRPQAGILLTVHMDELSKTMDPQMLIVQTKPFSLNGRCKEDINQCGGEIVETVEERNGLFAYTCDFGNFLRCAEAYEKLFLTYYVSYKKISPEDTWKHEVINDLSDKTIRRAIPISPIPPEIVVVPEPTPPQQSPVIQRIPPPTPVGVMKDCNLTLSLPIANEERKFKFYIKVRNDARTVSRVDEYVHELEGYKCSWIMDSKSDPKWRYVRVEFETDEHTVDAYNLMQLFPVENKVHYFIDFLK